MKIHFRAEYTKADLKKFKDSPHVLRGIREGLMTVCSIMVHGNSWITSEPDLVTCHACIVVAARIKQPDPLDQPGHIHAKEITEEEDPDRAFYTHPS